MKIIEYIPYRKCATPLPSKMFPKNAESLKDMLVELRPDCRILYVNAEDFVKQYSNAMLSHAKENFLDLFASLEILLVSDVQKLNQYEAAQKVLITIAENLIVRGKWVVLTTDSASSQTEWLKNLAQ